MCGRGDAKSCSMGSFASVERVLIMMPETLTKDLQMNGENIF